MPMAVYLQRPHDIGVFVETPSLPSGEYSVDTSGIDMTPQATTYDML